MRLRSLLVAGLALLLGCLSPNPAHAQRWGTVTGRVTDATDGAPLGRVTVLVNGTNFGTATNDQGNYLLRLPMGRHVLRFSLVGYRPYLDTLAVLDEAPITLNVRLHAALIELEDIVVEDSRPLAEPGVHTIDPRHIEDQPAVLQDGFRILKTMPGVATNNELSSEYSVRGGGYNENLVFINGFEVYKSFRMRKGEQEGLGIINPELAEAYTFYTGSFPARYGGKLSSTLDVRYRRPDGEALRGSASLSLLDASVAAGASALDGRLGWTVGLRQAGAEHLYATQQLEGVYEPLFEDAQATLAYRFAPGHELEALGIWQHNRFRLAPHGRDTEYGTLVASRLASFAFSGHEEDQYHTRLGSVRLKSRLSSRLRTEHDVAYYETEEQENFDVAGRGVVFDLTLDTRTGETLSQTPIGAFFQQERFVNRVRVRTLTGRQRWMLHTNRHAAEAGWHVRRLHFDDQLFELSRLAARTDTSGLPLDPSQITDAYADSIVVKEYHGIAAVTTWQAGGYVQDIFDLLPARNRLLVTAGIRADYYDFNGQWTVSPRLAARYRASADLTLFGSWGLYHQPPSYRELRGQPEPGQSLLDALNRNLKSQRAMAVTAGAEYLRPGNRLYFRAEAYYKRLARLISYSVEGIQTSYSGENDARGFVYGLDLHVEGEFVPGLESWVNYSFMVARERFLDAFQTETNDGLIPRPMDQRHTISLYVQDYIPTDPTWKLHMRALFGSGFPFTPPQPDQTPSGTVIHEPSARNAFRFLPYFRFDVGASKTITLSPRSFAAGTPVRLRLTGELLNVFDMVNTVRYIWVPEASGAWERIPTRLTPRAFNLRARIDF